MVYVSEFSIIAINVQNLTISKLSFSGGRIHFGHGSLATVEQNDGVIVLSTAHLTTVSLAVLILTWKTLMSSVHACTLHTHHDS